MNFSLNVQDTTLDPNKSMFYKFSAKGVIEYVNEYFIEFTGFQAFEMLGKNISEITHPEIPKSIYNLIEERFIAKKNSHFLMKDTTKSGRDFWYVSDFDIKTDAEGNVEHIVSLRKPAPLSAVAVIQPFYAKLVKIEESAGMDVAKKYLLGFLEEKQMSFSQYTNSLLVKTVETNSDNFLVKSKKKKSFWRW